MCLCYYFAECSKQFTAAIGHISSSNSARGTDACAIYITATPGESVQITFTDFKMADKDGNKTCVKVNKQAYRKGAT